MASKQELQKLVEQIKKMADPFTGNLGGTPAIPAGGHPYNPGAPSAHPSGGTWGGNTDVIALQQALQTFAKDVAGQINLDTVSKGGPEAQDAKMRDAFGVFLTKNYMRPDQVPSKEYDPTVKDTGDSLQAGQDAPTRMSLVMDTMSRIGSPRRKGERFVDGVWGTRTENALYNAYGFVSGLWQFVDDVNRFATPKHQVKVQSYPKDNLANFKKIIDLSADAAERNKLARYATEHVNHVREMFDEVKKQILEHPAYSQYIQGQTAFKSYGPRVSQEQIAQITQAFPGGLIIDLGETGKHKVPVEALQSVEALQNWIKTAVPSAGLTVSRVIELLRSYATRGF